MWNIPCLIVLLQYLIATNSVEINKDFDDVTGSVVTWEKFMSKAFWTTDIVAEWIKPYLNDSLNSGNISEACLNGLLLYFEGIKRWEPWSIKMLDATGRIPSGLMTGTLTDFGNFVECLQVRFHSDRRTEDFQGKFCMIGFKIALLQPIAWKTSNGESYLETYGNLPGWISEFMKEKRGFVEMFRLIIGSCLPSTCSDQDIHNLVSNATKPWASDVFVSDCQTDEQREWSTSGIIALGIFLVLCGICLLGTTLDLRYKNQVAVSKYYTPTKETLWRKSLKAFSLSSNSAKVFEPKKQKHFLDCIDGIRFFLSIWVILSHVSLYEEHWREMKYTSGYNMLTIFNVVTIFLVNAAMNMENFCVISGFFLVYSMKKKMDKNGGKINFIETIVHKLWRILPLFLLYVVLMLIVPNLSTGPIWNSSWEYEIKKCRQSWWMNMLLINNFVHNNDACMLHSWFAGMLIQIHVAGLVLLFVTYRMPKIGMALASAMISACILIVYETSVDHEFLMADFTYMKDMAMLRDWLSFIYFRPFNHFPSFVIGMALGWIILTHREAKLSFTIRTICWIFTIMFYAVGMYGIWIPTDNHRIIAAYYALRTLCWSFSTSWLLFNLLTGHMGFIHRFLSLDVFAVLCRISYSTYVMHPLVLLFRTASLKERVYAGVIDMLFDSLAIIVISTGLAYVAYISVELPFTSLYDIWHEKEKQEKITKGTINEKCSMHLIGEQKNYDVNKVKIT